MKTTASNSLRFPTDLEAKRAACELFRDQPWAMSATFRVNLNPGSPNEKIADIEYDRSLRATVVRHFD